MNISLFSNQDKIFWIRFFRRLRRLENKLNTIIDK